MARYTGPVCRLCRRAGEKLMLKGDRCLTPKCAQERRGQPPGPRSYRRRRISDRGVQLREKQKARQIYGVMERQFKKTFKRAEKRSGITGENLLQGMELRMDNVVFRLGFASSRNQARQLVRHGQFSLNGRMTNVPSCALKPDDVIAWMPKSQNMVPYKQAAENASAQYVPAWLALDEKSLEGRVVAAPGRGEIDIKINEQSIVEYYSR